MTLIVASFVLLLVIGMIVAIAKRLFRVAAICGVIVALLLARRFS